MNIRQDTWTGGEHYWIRFHRGIFEVRKESFPEKETVFVGHYEKCEEYLKNLLIENVEYDLWI